MVLISRDGAFVDYSKDPEEVLELRRKKLDEWKRLPEKQKQELIADKVKRYNAKGELV